MQGCFASLPEGEHYHSSCIVRIHWAQLQEPADPHYQEASSYTNHELGEMLKIRGTNPPSSIQSSQLDWAVKHQE
jgi:hypothetical protein